jgi:hypothetical protein
MKRCQWTSSAIVITIMLVSGACNLFSFTKLQTTPRPVIDIPYCDVDHSTLCIVSFGIDINNRMLVNFVKPDPSFPNFYLKIQHADITGTYECQTVKDTPTSIYCSGDRTPLGDPVNIEVYSSDKDQLIARGTFLIAAFALPTQIIVSPTATSLDTATATVPANSTITPTLRSANTALSTPTSLIRGTPTKTGIPTKTKTPIPGYPNP